MFEIPESPEHSFTRLYENAVNNPEREINYEGTPYPKKEFLKHLLMKCDVLLHGSQQVDLQRLEPRQANDADKVSGNRKAIYAVDDPVLPLFYAINDRSYQGVAKSGFSVDEDGNRSYLFALSGDVLAHNPWKSGVVYILRKDLFEATQNDDGSKSGEWTSSEPVDYIAKLAIDPEDFLEYYEVGSLSHPKGG